MSELSDKINDWMSVSRRDLINNYNRMGLRVTGKYERGLNYKLFGGSGTIRAVMYGEKHSDFMQNGRGPTKKKGNGNLREIIRAWIDNKGIMPRGISKDSLSYLITRKIHTEGIKVPNGANNPGYNKYNSGGVISNIITGERINELEKIITGILYKNLRSDVIIKFKRWQ